MCTWYSINQWEVELQIFLSAEWSLRSDAECTRGVIYSLPGWPVSRQKIAVAQKFYHFIFAGIKLLPCRSGNPVLHPFQQTTQLLSRLQSEQWKVLEYNLFLALSWCKVAEGTVSETWALTKLRCAGVVIFKFVDSNVTMRKRSGSKYWYVQP